MVWELLSSISLLRIDLSIGSPINVLVGNANIPTITYINSLLVLVTVITSGVRNLVGVSIIV